MSNMLDAGPMAVRSRRTPCATLACRASADSATDGRGEHSLCWAARFSHPLQREVSMSRYQLQRHLYTPPFMSEFAREVDQLQENIHRMFDNPITFTPGRLPRVESLGWVPPVEISENDKEIVMTVELPGLDKMDVKIDVADGVLTLSGEKRSEHKEESSKKDFFLEERSYGSFQRSFTLPPAVNTDTISAVFDKGVLKITLPKSEVVKPRGREIAIEAK
jgi:HSP20 family protein